MCVPLLFPELLTVVFASLQLNFIAATGGGPLTDRYPAFITLRTHVQMIPREDLKRQVSAVDQ